MSHFIGLCFVYGGESMLEENLAPYNEQDEDYCIFEDCTQELEEKFASLPEKDERLTPEGEPYPYPCDKEHYPTIKDLAEDWFGYRKNENGVYGYTHNPDAKWDWYAIGNRWSGYLLGKDGHEYNELKFDDVDWEKMFTPVEKTYTNYKGEEETYEDVHIPFCLVDTDGGWHERGEMGWWACVSNEKDADTWEEEVKSYIKSLQEKSAEERDDLMVYAVDFHI